MSHFDPTWSFVDDGNLTPNGFLFAGISAGLKASHKKDLALILAPEGSIFSGTFTQSIVRASCVDICEERIKTTSGFVRAILINSGQQMRAQEVLDFSILKLLQQRLRNF